jgi:hypothetical protein
MVTVGKTAVNKKLPMSMFFHEDAEKELPGVR